MKKTIRVVAAVIEQQGRILIARRTDGNQAGLWEFPGGKYEENETGPQAIMREIREEMECQIEVKEYLATVHHRYESFNLVMDCYICQLANGQLPVLHDHSAYLWLKPYGQKVDWLAADRKVIRAYRKRLRERKQDSEL